MFYTANETQSIFNHVIGYTPYTFQLARDNVSMKRGLASKLCLGQTSEN